MDSVIIYATWSAFAVGFVALVTTGRVIERHHLYWGLPFLAVPWPPAHAVALVVVADDAMQHTWQAVCRLRGRPVPADFSPMHRAWVHMALYVASRAWCPASLRRWLLR
jgi:hypothetical protein